MDEPVDQLKQLEQDPSENRKARKVARRPTQRRYHDRSGVHLWSDADLSQMDCAGMVMVCHSLEPKVQAESLSCFHPNRKCGSCMTPGSRIP